jgi:hypothetical protein
MNSEATPGTAYRTAFGLLWTALSLWVLLLAFDVLVGLHHISTTAKEVAGLGMVAKGNLRIAEALLPTMFVASMQQAAKSIMGYR